MTFHQAASCDFLDLADDARKVALYEMVRSGYELVGVAGDRFALLTGEEMPSGVDHEGALRVAAESATGEVLTYVPASCRVVALTAAGDARAVSSPRHRPIYRRRGRSCP